MSVAMEQPQQGRPRSKSTFSFKSDNSHSSTPKHERKNSASGHQRKESDSYKPHLNTTGKADPNAAMNESQPKVMSGYNSRRSSYYGGGGHHDQGRFSQASGYYGSRQAARDSWQDNGHGMGGPVGGPPRARYNRMQTDPGWNRYPQSNGNGNGVYPVQGYQQSRDTVNTNGSNGSHSEPYSTEPSSDNSSIERAAGMKPDLGEQYGFQGFGGGPNLDKYQNGMGPSNNGYAVQRPNGTLNYGAPPPVPTKQGVPPAGNNPIKLTKSGEGPANGDGRPAVLQRQNTDKRKSWFKRRFSKD
ncbi:hypothetical protein N0V90_006279 [Kalmusia sp. IMI 367209]|nr:hypothetical protein N0V90_006279 [Kalmusia sp. IMI 367209]